MKKNYSHGQRTCTRRALLAGRGEWGIFILLGQIAIDPKTNVVNTGPIHEQAKIAMENIRAVLDEAGLGFNNVVKTTIFLTNMNDFAQVNEIYATYFTDHRQRARQLRWQDFLKAFTSRLKCSLKDNEEALAYGLCRSGHLSVLWLALPTRKKANCRRAHFGLDGRSSCGLRDCADRWAGTGA